MSAPATTVWDLEPHSRAKHEILRRYMQAWIPILGQGGFPELVYIDGFAGPGRYSKSEDGSPIIALRVALEHEARIKSRITFLFVEQRYDRASVLDQILDEVRRPPRFVVEVARGLTFERAVGSFLDEIATKGRRPPPIFAFVDPFGWSGVPFQLVSRIMSFPNCEVLITFMYEEINRFIGVSQQDQNFNSFFGTAAWRQAIELNNPRQRNRYLHDLYVSQLRESAGVKCVRSFEMRNNRDVIDYYLFYATNNLLGLKKMKEAMWRIDSSGEFSFSDATDPRQLVLFAKEPDFDLLRREIVKQFGGRETTVGEIETFVVSETAFRETHFKRQVLRPLEISDPPLLVLVSPPTHRRPGTYPDPRQRVRFA